MKKTAGLIFALTAFATAAQAQDFSANDMNVPLSQLYPGTVQQAAAASTTSRDQVTADFQRSRMVGTVAQYSAVGGYQLRMSNPELFVEKTKVAGKTREEVKAEYQASRPANSPAAFSSLDSYQVSQAFPGNAVEGNALNAGNQFAGKATRSNVQ